MAAGGERELHVIQARAAQEVTANGRRSATRQGTKNGDGTWRTHNGSRYMVTAKGAASRCEEHVDSAEVVREAQVDRHAR